MSSANSESNDRWELAHTRALVGEFIGRQPDRDGGSEIEESTAGNKI